MNPERGRKLFLEDRFNAGAGGVELQNMNPERGRKHEVPSKEACSPVKLFQNVNPERGRKLRESVLVRRGIQ